MIYVYNKRDWCWDEPPIWIAGNNISSEIKRFSKNWNDTQLLAISINEKEFISASHNFSEQRRQQQQQWQRRFNQNKTKQSKALICEIHYALWYAIPFHVLVRINKWRSKLNGNWRIFLLSNFFRTVVGNYFVTTSAHYDKMYDRNFKNGNGIVVCVI